jgi:hypothetical protein
LIPLKRAALKSIKPSSLSAGSIRMSSTSASTKGFYKMDSIPGIPPGKCMLFVKLIWDSFAFSDSYKAKVL